MKATEHYFPVVLFSMLYKEVPQANQTYCVIPGVIYGLKAADVGGIFNRFHQNKIAVIFVCFSWLFLVVLCTKQPNFGAFACKNCTEKIESQCSCPYELLLKPNYKDHRRCLFPFRKRSLPFLTVDAIIGSQACSIADVIVCSGMCYDKAISNFFKSS